MSIIVFIIGMHRSGTSLLSNCLVKNGFSIGKSLNKDKNVQNPNGYFENDAFTHFHDSLLHYNSSTWCNISDKKMTYLIEHIQQYRKLIKTEFDDSKYILIKDPRLTFFVNFIKDVCEDIFDYHILFLTRNKDECCHSLNTAQSIGILNCEILYDKTMSKYQNEFMKIDHKDIVYKNDKVINNIGKYCNITLKSTSHIVDKRLHRSKSNLDYFYTHVVSYYEGNNRLDNLYAIFEVLNTQKLSKNKYEKILIVYCIIKDNAPDVNTIEIYEKLKKLKNNNIDIQIYYRFNTGGTVQTMYQTYKYLIQNKITTKYIGVWEDDCIFKNENILDEVQVYLDKGCIYVGSYWDCEDGYALPLNINGGVKRLIPNKPNRIVPWVTNSHIIPHSNDSTFISDDKYLWCEDPYITTMDNLKLIDKKMGCFTLAPLDQIYTHCEHGINYGEVGFPTRLHLNGFTFFGLLKRRYFMDLKTFSIGNKSI